MPVDLKIKKRASVRGSALISALFIMTLVAIAATAMSARLQLDIYRARITINTDKLYLASEAVTFWAFDVLSKIPLPFHTNDKEGKLIGFPKQLQHIYPDLSIKGALYDLQGRFNLNNLQDKRFIPIFIRLLEKSFDKNHSSNVRAIVESIQYWIGPYQPDRGKDDYLTYYLGQQPPYLPSYQLMQSLSELRLIRGVSYKIYQALLPNLSVLPETTAININTASKLLLMSLGNGLNESQVEELLNERGKNGITNLQNVRGVLEKLGIPNDQITLESTYYLCKATVTSEEFDLTLYTIIKRYKDQKNKLSVGIISQSINTM